MNIGDQISHTNVRPASGPYRLNLGLNWLIAIFMFCAIFTENIDVLCKKIISYGSVQNTP
jgi:hypothetical protein